MYGAPVDLSFQSITSVADAQEPRAGLRPLRKNKENRYLCGSLRLNNNNIADLSNFLHNVSRFLAEPRKLAWLDLSFNSMSHIDTVLCELQELRVLYLHGNNICSLSEVDKLGELLYLHTITLHGNLIENQPGYRTHIISVLPHLKKVDFSAVTGQEKAMAKIWHRHDNPGKLTIQQSPVHRTSD